MSYGLVLNLQANDETDVPRLVRDSILAIEDEADEARQRVVAAAREALVTLGRVLTDSESQHPGGWGPDVTTVADLRDCQNILLAGLEGAR